MKKVRFKKVEKKKLYKKLPLLWVQYTWIDDTIMTIHLLNFEHDRFSRFGRTASKKNSAEKYFCPSFPCKLFLYRFLFLTFFCPLFVFRLTWSFIFSLTIKQNGKSLFFHSHLLNSVENLAKKTNPNRFFYTFVDCLKNLIEWFGLMCLYCVWFFLFGIYWNDLTVHQICVVVAAAVVTLNAVCAGLYMKWHTSGDTHLHSFKKNCDAFDLCSFVSVSVCIYGTRVCTAV